MTDPDITFPTTFTVTSPGAELLELLCCQLPVALPPPCLPTLVAICKLLPAAPAIPLGRTGAEATAAFCALQRLRALFSVYQMLQNDTITMFVVSSETVMLRGTSTVGN